MEWLSPPFHSTDKPIPMLGLTPWRGRVDCATRCGAVALRDEEMVAPRDGAGGGGGACCGHGAHRGGVGEGQGQALRPLPCNSPQEQTPIVLQYHLFSIQILLTRVFLLWHFTIRQGAAVQCFLHFFLKY